MALADRLRTWAGSIKREAVALWFAARDPRTPLLPKVLCAFVVAYALSPIDLIPDFIPVLGYADDAIVVCWVLRSVIRATASDLVEAHWPGTADGLAVVRRLTGVEPGGASRG